MSPTSLVKLIREMDNHMHYLEAKRAVRRERPRMDFDEWVKMYRKLLFFAGTPHALRLIEYSKH